MKIIILIKKPSCDIPYKSFEFKVSKKRLKEGIEIDICRDGIGNILDLMQYYIIKEDL